jgi:hypothetical protein
MAALYPPVEPYHQSMLDTGDGNLVCREACGDPAVGALDRFVPARA